MGLSRAAILLGALSLAGTANADEPGAATGFHLESRHMTGFYLVGGLLLAMGHAGGLVVAANAGFDNGSAWMAVPIVGPYVGAVKARDLGHCGAFDPPTRTRQECNASIELPGLVALAVIQIIGAALLPFGTLRRQTWAPNVVPTLSLTGGAHLGISATF